jgi:hypothetical protein
MIGHVSPAVSAKFRGYIDQTFEETSIYDSVKRHACMALRIIGDCILNYAIKFLTCVFSIVKNVVQK